jgi:predicted ATPase/DNA-binding winged helix-turn-helix (wHTH) protein
MGLPAELSAGRVRLLPAKRQLFVDGEPVALGARAFDLLLALVERADRVVSKHELLEAVWPGLVVEENNLQVQVSALRKVLGANAIATVPGRGYRLALAFGVPGAPATGTEAGPTDVPPAATLPPAAAPRLPGNVPAPADALIGRDAELAELAALARQHREVSIVGAGGIGKTRVALALAERLRARFADGAWWIELAALSSPSLVPETIARAVGVGLASGRPADEALATALTGLELLLVLDNCEHLLDGVGACVEHMLERAPGVHVVVTSQEPLKLRAEHVYRLATLGLPPAGDAPADDVAHSSAVTLFVERARAADPHFRLDDGNAAAVAEICRRLDGIALAIELAAARLPLLGVEGLRQRLGDRFRLLTAGSRTVLRRHQTLHAALEWSHALLGDDEQAVFRRLGVFAGGCTLAMAQAVCRDDARDDWAVLDALGGLVDKSLVVAEGAGEPRYRLLETTRAFALERLAAAGETEALLRRHAAAVLDWLRGVSGEPWRWYVDRRRRAAIAAELDNVRAALDWSAGENGDRALAVALFAESVDLWFVQAGQAEGLAVAQRLRGWVDDTLPALTVARFWFTYAQLGVFSTRSDCFDAAREAADRLRALGERQLLYRALVVRAGIGGRRLDAAAADVALEEAARIEDPQWPPYLRAGLAFAQWIVALRAERFDEARAAARRQAQLQRAAGSALGEQIALANLASCDVWGHEPARAVPQLRSTIAELERLGYGEAAGHMVYNLANALLDLGELDEALQQARRACALLRREGDQDILWGTLVRLTAARGRAQAALRLSGYAQRLRRVAGLDDNGFTVWAEASVPASIGADARQRLRAEGEALDEAQAFALALADRD